jgi:hypothetical protein
MKNQHIILLIGSIGLAAYFQHQAGLQAHALGLTAAELALVGALVGSIAKRALS